MSKVKAVDRGVRLSSYIKTKGVSFDANDPWLSFRRMIIEALFDNGSILSEFAYSKLSRENLDGFIKKAGITDANKANLILDFADAVLNNDETLFKNINKSIKKVWDSQDNSRDLDGFNLTYFFLISLAKYKDPDSNVANKALNLFKNEIVDNVKSIVGARNRS